MDKLNNPERIVISFNHNKIAIAKQLPNNENYLSIKHLLHFLMLNILLMKKI